jgi:hypothetical protein
MTAAIYAQTCYAKTFYFSAATISQPKICSFIL